MRQQQHKQHQTHNNNNNNNYYLQQRCRRALCCSRLSVSSSSEPESISGAGSSSSSERFVSVSTLAHAMVQERLDQLINQRQQHNQYPNNNNYSPSTSTRRQRNNVTTSEIGTKFVLMVAVEKCSDDPGEDFRESMVEMITANRIHDPRDLRTLLNYYVTMNPSEFHGLIFEVFHQVCSSLFFLSCNNYKPSH